MTDIGPAAATPGSVFPRPFHPPRRDGRDVAIVALGQVFQQVLTLGTGVVVARVLGASGYGIINLLRTIFTAFQTVSPLGLDLALLKFCGQNAADRGYVDATVTRLRLIAFAINTVLGLGIGLGLGGILMRHVYPFPGFDRLFLVTFLGLPLATDLAILGAFYKGINKPGIFALLTIYLQPVVRLFLIVLVLLTSLTTFSIICINTGQIAISLAAVLINLRFWQQSDIVVRRPADSKTLRTIFNASLWMASSLFVYGMMRFVDITMLGAYTTSKDVGEYGALSMIAQLIPIYPLAASQTLGPNISRSFHSGDMAGVKAALDRYIYLASIIASFIFAGIVVFGDRLDLVFGHSFRFQPLVVFLLPLGYLLSATLAPTGYALSMTGRHRAETMILCMGAGFLVLSCWLLIPVAGQVGAALSTAGCFALINIVRFVYVSSVLHFVPGKMLDLLPPFLALACAYIARFGIDAVFNRALVPTIIGCIVFTGLYAGVCMIGLVPPEDGVEIRRLLVSRFKIRS